MSLGRHNNGAPRDGQPRCHSSALIRDCTLGRYTDVAERVLLSEATLGDYSYIERDVEIIYASIGKFCAIAAHTRINALNHPLERVSQHKITYRPNEYFLFAKVDKEFRARRQELRVEIGHDVWIGHGAVIMPGVKIGTGAVIAAGAVVTKDVAPYEIVAGVPAKYLRWRFEEKLRAEILQLAWWDWPHGELAQAVDDMRLLSAQDFVDKWQVLKGDKT